VAACVDGLGLLARRASGKKTNVLNVELGLIYESLRISSMVNVYRYYCMGRYMVCQNCDLFGRST